MMLTNAHNSRQQDINARNSATQDINWEEEIQFDPGKGKK